MTRQQALWWVWGIGATLWIVFALQVFPQTHRVGELWPAVARPDRALVTYTDCAAVREAVVAAGCSTIERMARQRRENLRERRFLNAVGAAGLMIGPPLAVLFAGFLWTVIRDEAPLPAGAGRMRPPGRGAGPAPYRPGSRGRL